MRSRPRRRRIPANLIAGSIVLGAIVALAVLGPYIAPYPYDEIHARDRLKAPGATYWLGTDDLGRDVLSRTLDGSRLSLFIGLAATLVNLAFGVPLGLIAGHFRGRVDELIMRSLDVIVAFPPVIFVMLILTVTPPALWKTTVTIGCLFTPGLARITRSVVLDLRGQEFIQAAQARGETAWYIVLHELLPNAWPPIIVEASLRVTFAILVGAVLSFLGLGVRPPAADWGLMISEARSFLDQAPWIALVPGAAMCITVVAVNLVGDGLRELLDPKGRGRR
ncbi:MAG TPA: ABC transporter permease [Methylomirabilota bacterium]|nr:ABC transporter permease [Methylomirabilota bacterium]